MTAYLLAHLCGQKGIAHLTDVEPRAASLYEAAVCRTVGELITVSLAYLGDGAAAVVHVIGAWSIHIFSVELPLPAIVKLILAYQCHLIGMIVIAVGHVPCLHFTGLGVEIPERSLTLNVRIEAGIEARQLLDAAVTGIDEGSCIGEVARVLAVRILI